jgi:hypothetical protein
MYNAVTLAANYNHPETFQVLQAAVRARQEAEAANRANEVDDE